MSPHVAEREAAQTAAMAAIRMEKLLEKKVRGGLSRYTRACGRDWGDVGGGIGSLDARVRTAPQALHDLSLSLFTLPAALTTVAALPRAPPRLHSLLLSPRPLVQVPLSNELVIACQRGDAAVSKTLDNLVRANMSAEEVSELHVVEELILGMILEGGGDSERGE